MFGYENVIIDPRTTSNKITWIRSPLKVRGIKMDTYKVSIFESDLFDSGLDYEETEGGDLIVRAPLADVLNICTRVKEIFVS